MTQPDVITNPCGCNQPHAVHERGDQAWCRAARAEEQIARLTEERDEARSWARHGYEIGQRSTLWSDYGVAPKWLTDGWPRSFEADPVTKVITQLDEILTHYRAQPRFKSDRLRSDLWDLLGISPDGNDGDQELVETVRRSIEAERKAGTAAKDAAQRLYAVRSDWRQIEQLVGTENADPEVTIERIRRLAEQQEPPTTNQTA